MIKIKNIFLIFLFTMTVILTGAEKQQIIIPEKLKEGDTIGLIAPANYKGTSADDEVEYLINRGFKVVYGKSFDSMWYGFGGIDEMRAEDINDMFANKEIKAIFAIRGGYGSIRIVDKLDYEVIKKNPKIFSGYSDITTLLIAINEKTGLVTYHGPMSSNFRDIPEVTETSFNKTFIEVSEFNLAELDNEYFVIRNGKGEGKITGGNLSLIVASLGTEYEINTDGKILFIEEVNEPTYRIDRMLKQLKLAGKLKNLKGVILGDFKNPRKAEPNDMNLNDVFEDNFGKMNIPVISGLDSGHVRPFITVPIGAKAKIDTYKGEIIIEKSVK
ncbi:LD-carboxypeptidase [Leptotrichia sp. OH3620_COT-345]|uniref:S66 peptidase family protein n=1 Tax=Leptotrichia sp. OH3620_COT-345 TaxID=2491048 RepID=UPI000F64BF43|nr:LD-carboxypeptidase [Leptotrichia sp. OH3620_COT-345]RRD39216.1 LD-carboxypeptidase [Leptotrichia sp. OH3620_COT-345]